MRLALVLALMLVFAGPILAGLAQAESGIGYRDDARSHAGEAAIRDARRAYRAECQLHQSADYCECMTGGMSQALAPEDLNAATALLAHRLSGAPGPEHVSRAAARAAEEASERYDPLCRGFRR